MISHAPTFTLHVEGKAYEQLVLTLRNDLEELARVYAVVNALLERHAIEQHVVYATHLALEEVLSNVIRHGYGDGGRHEIEVLLRVGAGSVEVEVLDDGHEFNPLTAAGSRVDVPLAQRRAGGLGLRLLRGFVSEVRYARRGTFNSLWMRI